MLGRSPGEELGQSEHRVSHGGGVGWGETQSIYQLTLNYCQILTTSVVKMVSTGFYMPGSTYMPRSRIARQ